MAEVGSKLAHTGPRGPHEGLQEGQKRPKTSIPYLRSAQKGSYFISLKGPDSGARPGRFPRNPPRGSPSDAPLA
eukprot:2588891-Pyramimonas_sp.AAC.1